ncbi:MAG: FtsX-like permease family protein [Planctomycetaceae bacterium]|nr:FtsX-like permease family protein [Planctomycetaceae bacterium]
MKTPLAWRNLIHDKARNAVAIVGVGFAVLLILMQLGFYGSVLQTATTIQDHLTFDLLIASKNYLFITRPGSFAEARLHQARGVAGVVDAWPLGVSLCPWENPATGRRRAMLVLSCEPHLPAVRVENPSAALTALERPSTVMIDRRSRPEFGPQAAGTRAKMGPLEVEIAGQFTLGTGFGADGAVLTSARTFARLFPQVGPQATNLGLVQLAPGADPDRVAAELRERLPADVQVFTRPELNQRERQHWVVKTSVGVIFGLGVAMALVVGMAIVYQVLSSSIARRLREYATLKALGYPTGYLWRVVLTQAIALAVAGYLPGLLVAWQLYGVTRSAAHIPMQLGWVPAVSVLFLAVGMCAAAGVISLRKVTGADPAELF